MPTPQGCGIKVVITDKAGTIVTSENVINSTSLADFVKKISIGNLATGNCTVDISMNMQDGGNASAITDAELTKVTAWLTTI